MNPRAGSGNGRRVSLGTIPDFTYTEGGYRLSGVRPGSPADNAGLQEGDIIIVTIDGAELLNIARDRITRSFTQLECDTYRIDPCPTLIDIRSR